MNLKTERKSIIKIIKTIKEMQGYTERLRRENQKIAFVPTMGYLHDGHLSLLRVAAKHGDCIVLSIFVNPTQFGPNEDLDAYPRDMDNDIQLAKSTGTDVLFAPSEKDFYPERYQTYVTLDQIPHHLCGLSRPVHFRGVATIVAKLFNVVRPHAAIFGLKDYQQVLVIRQMVADLNFDIEIIGAPTLREPDGLAMSSRNANLPDQLRSSALALYQSMMAAKKHIEEGKIKADEIIAEATRFIESYPETEIDYIAICDPETLGDVEIIRQNVLMALAVKVGGVRLIDNMILSCNKQCTLERPE